jgi:hypothetical protein
VKKPKIPQGHDMSNPFRAAHTGGHELNESYKLPAPNASGTNDSYMHPAHNRGGSSNTVKLDAKQNRPAGPIKLGKNPF